MHFFDDLDKDLSKVAPLLVLLAQVLSLLDMRFGHFQLFLSMITTVDS